MDTTHSLAVFLCAVTASFAFPAGFWGYGGKMAPRLPAPTPARFIPQAVTRPAITRLAITRPAIRPVTVNAPMQVTLVQASRPVNMRSVIMRPVTRPAAGNVIVDGGSMDGGDGIVVMGGSGTLGNRPAVVSSDGLVDPTLSVGGDLSISDSTLHVINGVPGGRLVYSGGAASLGNGVRTISTRPVLVPANTVGRGLQTVVGTGGLQPVVGTGGVPTVVGTGGLQRVIGTGGVQTVVGGDMSISDSNVNMLNDVSVLGSPNAVGGGVSLGGGVQMVPGTGGMITTLPAGGLGTHIGDSTDMDLVSLGNGQVAVQVNPDTPNNVISTMVRPLSGYPGAVSSSQTIIVSSDGSD